MPHGLHSSNTYISRWHLGRSRLVSVVMLCGGHRPHCIYTSYAHIFRRHMKRSRLGSSVMTSGGYMPHGLHSSNTYVSRWHLGRSRLVSVVMLCGGHRPHCIYTSYAHIFRIVNLPILMSIPCLPVTSTRFPIVNSRRRCCPPQRAFNKNYSLSTKNQSPSINCKKNK